MDGSIEKIKASLNFTDIFLFIILLGAAFYFNTRSVKYIQSIVFSPSKTSAVVWGLTIMSAISFMFYIAYLRLVFSDILIFKKII